MVKKLYLKIKEVADCWPDEKNDTGYIHLHIYILLFQGS